MKSYNITLRDIRPFVFAVLTSLALAAVLSPSDAWASKKQIVIGAIQADPDTPACVINCQIDFSVYACDPEKDCDPEKEGDQEEDNEVLLDWQVDGGGWVNEQEGCQTFEHNDTFSTTGEHTIQARARESDTPTHDCNEEDEDPQTAEKVICLYTLYAALVNDQTEGVEVDCGDDVDISAGVYGECDDITLFYYVTCEGELVDVYEAGPDGCYFTPKPAGTWTLQVWPENDCDCGPVSTEFEVNPTCEENCCGPVQDTAQFGSPDCPPRPTPPPEECTCGPPGNKWSQNDGCGEEMRMDCSVSGQFMYFEYKFDGTRFSCCCMQPGVECTIAGEGTGTTEALNTATRYMDANGRLVKAYHENWLECHAGTKVETQATKTVWYYNPDCDPPTPNPEVVCDGSCSENVCSECP